MRSKLFSVNVLSVLLGESSSAPLALGSMVKRRAQPGAGTSLAGLNNSRCGSLIECYGISIKQCPLSGKDRHRPKEAAPLTTHEAK
jgi:hypothetical protein